MCEKRDVLDPRTTVSRKVYFRLSIFDLFFSRIFETDGDFVGTIMSIMKTRRH